MNQHSKATPISENDFIDPTSEDSIVKLKFRQVFNVLKSQLFKMFFFVHLLDCISTFFGNNSTVNKEISYVTKDFEEFKEILIWNNWNSENLSLLLRNPEFRLKRSVVPLLTHKFEATLNVDMIITSHMSDDQLWKIDSVIHLIWHVLDSYYFIKVKRHSVCPSCFIYVNKKTKSKSHVLKLPKLNLTSETFGRKENEQ